MGRDTVVGQAGYVCSQVKSIVSRVREIRTHGWMRGRRPLHADGRALLDTLERSAVRREWPKVFGDDEKLTTALLDRLADRATVIVTKGKSYRMRRRQAQPTAPEPEEPETTKTKKR